MMRSAPRHILTGIVLLIAGTGAWLSGDLLKQHAGLWSRSTTAEPCTITGVALGDCTATLDHAWSVVQLPWPELDSVQGLRWETRVLPVAFIGLAYFVFMGCWSAFAGIHAPRTRRSWHLVVAGCSIPVSLLCAGVMVAGRVPLCPRCITVHLLNAALVIILIMAARRAVPTTASGPSKNLPTLFEVVRAASVALIVIAALWMYRGERLALQHQIDNGVAYRKIVDGMRSDERTLWHAFAQDESAVIERPALTLFVDYQCPGCACALTRLRRQAEHAFGDELSVGIRHFPLSTTCNDAIDANHHPGSCTAAYAAEAARMQGGTAPFERMHHLLLRHRGPFDAQALGELAGRADLDRERFIDDVNSDHVRALVARDIALAQRLGVQSTPAVYLNGRNVPQLCRTTRFWELAAGRMRRYHAQAAPCEVSP